MNRITKKRRRHLSAGHIGPPQPAVAKKVTSRQLFHYTTAQGLVGIIKNQSLFATHADFSNDASKCKLALPFIKKILQEEFRRIVPRLIELKLMHPYILRDYGETLYEREAENSVRAMMKATNNTAPYFITSFCLHDEDSEEYRHGLLSQWRGYGRGGFAIQFDELEIDELNNLESAKWNYQGMITREVSYQDHEATIEPLKYKGLAGTLMRQIVKKESDEISQLLGTSSLGDYARKFLGTAPFIKHPDFKEEREYRIVALCTRPGKNEGDDARPHRELRFRTRSDGSVIPYIALYEGLDRRLPIKSIIIGPHARQEEQRLAVDLLLEQHDVKAEVKLSSTPFRE